MRTKGLTALICSIVALVSVSLTALGAQDITGTISGVVRDKTGAVVPGAKIEVTNTNTGVKYETVANESG